MYERGAFQEEGIPVFKGWRFQIACYILRICYVQSRESEVECGRPEKPKKDCVKRRDHPPGTIGKTLKWFKQRSNLIRLSRKIILALMWESEGRIRNRTKKVRKRLRKGNQLEDFSKSKKSPRLDSGACGRGEDIVRAKFNFKHVEFVVFGPSTRDVWEIKAYCSLTLDQNQGTPIWPFLRLLTG